MTVGIEIDTRHLSSRLGAKENKVYEASNSRSRRIRIRKRKKKYPGTYFFLLFCILFLWAQNDGWDGLVVWMYLSCILYCYCSCCCLFSQLQLFVLTMSDNYKRKQKQKWNERLYAWIQSLSHTHHRIFVFNYF